MSDFLLIFAITAGGLGLVALTCFLAVQAVDGGGWPFGVAAFLLLALLISGIGYAINQSTKPASGVVKWRGGDGAATVCWAATEDDPDTVVMAGKTPVVVDGGTSAYTYCSKDGTGIPEGVHR